MCGIVGIVGIEPSAIVALAILKRLEGRGYDAAGIAGVQDNHVKALKRLGKITELERAYERDPIESTTVMAHTRWATHGNRKDERNAHPHLSMDGTIAVVHNGTVKNYVALRKKLSSEGYLFASETDTEVLVHLIDRELRALSSDFIPHYKFERAVANALAYVEGDDCALLVTSSQFPSEIVAARRNRPLVVGMENGATYIASDAFALAGKVSRVLMLEKGAIATLSSSGIHIEGFDSAHIERLMKPIDVKAEEIVLSGYPHWMLKEIYEQTASIGRALEGRVRNGHVTLEMLSQHEEVWRNAERVYIIACGTSFHAGMLAKYFIEGVARVPVEMVIGSEWQSAKALLTPRTPIIGLSQSGMTADVVDPLSEARDNGVPIFGITNSPTSQLAGMVAGGIFLKAGHEAAVASTKTFTAQVAILALVGAGIAELRGMGDQSELLTSLTALPTLIEAVLACEEVVQDVAQTFEHHTRFIFMGRGSGYPIALEGALKLKEIAYVDAHGHPGGEFKHGHLALVEKNTPVFGMIFDDGNADKMLTSLHQAKTSGGKIIVLDATGRDDVAAIADYLISLPKASALLSPILAAIPLQLLSYWSGIRRGNDVDQPRNLAKSVTVE